MPIDTKMNTLKSTDKRNKSNSKLTQAVRQNRILLYYIVNNLASYSDNAKTFWANRLYPKYPKQLCFMIKHKDIGHIVFR